MAKLIRLDIVNGYPVSVVAPAELEQGDMLAVKELATGEYQSFACELAKADSKGMICIHASVPFGYADNFVESEFKVAKGDMARAYILAHGDIVTIAESCVAESVVVGDTLGLHSSKAGKLAKGGDLFTVVAKENYGGQASIVIRKH